MQEVFIKTVVSDSEDVFCYINKHVEPVNIVELKDPESVSIDILLHCNMAITYSLSINIYIGRVLLHKGSTSSVF